jgi:CO/xanthine dehydrogenase Mo-binding subunit
VIHFNQVPASIEIVLINHPDQLTQAAGNVPAWGAGEPTIGVIPPAIANAIFNAVGARATSLPMTATKVAALF